MVFFTGALRIEGVVVVNLKGAFSIVVKCQWRATSPPPTPIISLDTSNKNFEINILFSVAGMSSNYVFEDDSPQRKGCTFWTYKAFKKKRSHKIWKRLIGLEL